MNLNDARSKIPELDGLDDQQALSVIHQAYYPDMDRAELGKTLGVKPAAPKQEEKGDVRRGFEKAMLQVPQTLGGAAALVGDAVGSDGLKDYGLEIYKRRSQQIEDITRPSDSFSSVMEGEGNLADFLQSGAGYVGGQVLTSVATGGAGGFIGAQLAKQGVKKAIAAGVAKEVAQQGVRRGAIAGATTAAFGGNLVQEAGGIYPEALETAEAEGRLAPDGGLTGGDLARVGGSAIAAAGVDTAMDAVMAGRVLKGARKPGESLLRAGAREVPGAMAREGVTEGIQTGIERFGAQKDLTTADAIRDYVDSMALGALGGGMGGGISVLQAQKQPDTGPLARAANAGIDQQILQLTHDPQPLISFPDGSVGHKQDVEAYLSQFTDEAERTAKRRELMGRDPATGKRIQPEPEPEPTAADNEANSEANLKAWSSKHDAVPLDYAQALLAAPGAKGKELMIAPHASGKGYTVIPSKWLSLDAQTKAMHLQKSSDAKITPYHSKGGTDDSANRGAEAGTPRDASHTGIRDVDIDAGQVPRPDGPVVPEVRSEGDNGLPGVADQLSGVLPGHGAATNSESLNRSDKREEGIQPGQLPLGDAHGANSKPVQRLSDNVSGENTDRNGVGAGTRSEAEDLTATHEVGLEPGTDDGRKGEWLSGQSAKVDSQRANTDDSAVGKEDRADANNDYSAIQSGLASKPSTRGEAGVVGEEHNNADSKRENIVVAGLGAENGSSEKNNTGKAEAGMVARESSKHGRGHIKSQDHHVDRRRGNIAGKGMGQQEGLVSQNNQGEAGTGLDARTSSEREDSRILNPKGEPFKTKMAADRKVRELGGQYESFEVKGGYAVRPLPERAAQEAVADAEGGNPTTTGETAHDGPVRAGEVFRASNGEAITVTRVKPGGKVEVRIQGKRTRLGDHTNNELKKLPRIGRAEYLDGAYVTPKSMYAQDVGQKNPTPPQAETPPPTLAKPAKIKERAEKLAAKQERPQGEPSGNTARKPAAQKNGPKERMARDNPFLAFIGEHGISPLDRSDTGAEAGKAGTRLIPGYGPAYRKMGKRLDELASLAHEAGFLSTADIEDATDTGGTRKLADLIERALHRKEVILPAGAHEASAEAQAESRELTELRDEANRLGIDGYADMDGDALYDAVRAKHAEQVGATSADEYDAIEFDADMLEAAGITDEEINALARMASNENQLSDEDIDAAFQGRNEAEEVSTGTAEGNDARASGESDSGVATAAREPGGEEGFSLSAETADEARARIAAEEKAAKDAAKAEREAKDAEKAAQAKKEIAARQDASAENFQLGQSAEEGLSGQKGLLDGDEETLGNTSASDTITIDGVERATKNSDGKQISYTTAGLRDFWKWFGDSAVKDAEGRPLVVYHGTADDIAEFKDTDWNKKDQGWLGRGYYFTTNKETARSYSNLKPGKSDPRVMSLYLRIENPKVATQRDKEVGMFAERRGDKEAPFRLRDELKAAGHDGVMLDYSKGGWAQEIEYVAFDPTQIKSVENRGTWRGDDADILGNVQRDIKLQAAYSAMDRIARGADEAVAPGLRPDLQAFGGSADVHFVWGDAKKGLQHIGMKRGADVVRRVVEAVALGADVKHVPAKKTVRISHDGMTAVLSLDEHGKQKTWLLTGWEEGRPDAGGEVGTRSAATQSAPTFSRDDLGAGLKDILRQNDGDESAGRGQNAGDISALDRGVLIDIASGKGLTDVLNRIAAESSDVGQKEVAQRLLAAKLKTTVEIGNAQGAQFAVKGISAANFAAGYKPRADAILLFKPQSAAVSILHESMHAATFKAIRAGGIAARQMQALYDHVAKSGLLNGLYEMENIDEFVVGAFTNPQVQDLLREIPAAADGTSRFANAWAKFVSIVRNILGLKNDTALEQILRAGDALMAENEAIRSAEANETVLGRAIGDTIKNLTVSDIKQKTGNKLADYRSLALQALGRRQLVDIYANDFKPANGESILQQYSDLVQRMDADKNESGAEADSVADRWSKLKDEKPLADLMHDATLAQIDPDKKHAAGDDRAQYDALKARFAALSPEAQQVYRDARDMYAAHYKKVSDEIKARITRAMPDNATRATMLKKMDAEFFKSIKGVYFPLGRYGDYLVTVKDAAGNTLSVSSAETLNEAEATRKALQQQFPNQVVSKVLKRKEFNAARDSVSRGFLKQLFGVFDQYDVGDEMQEMVNQLYLSSMPDLSWAKHGIHRKGTPGFSQDARRAFAKNMFHGARYLAKLKYSDRMTDKLDEMQKHVDGKATDPDYDSVKGQHVVDEMLKRHDSYLNPQTSNLSTTLTSVGYLFYMGLSPASAAVNLTGTPLMAFPILGGKYGFAKAGKALMAASSLIAKGRNDLSKVLTGERLAAYQEAVNAGVIDVTMAHDLAGIAAGNDQQLGGKMRQAMKWAGWMFHHVERYNRAATLLASYDLAREQGKTHEEAYKGAIDDVYASQFDYSSGNRPRIMQGNVARVVLLFKQFAQNLIYTMTRNAIKAAKGDKVAQRTLAGLLVSHALGAGVLGLPVVGLLLSAASAIGGDDDEPWDAKVALRNYTADLIGQKPAEVLMHGLSRLTPFDLSGRIGLDKLLLPDIQEGLEGQRAAEAWALAALGPVAGIGAGVAKGMADIGKGDYQRGLESMMPVALRNPIKALRFAQEGVQDKTGVAILDETTPLEEIGQALGFSPSRSREAFEGKAAIYNADKALQARRQSLMTQYAHARQADDQESAKEIREDIQAFNQKNPSRRITGQNLIASLRMRNKRIEQAEQGIYLPKKRRGVMEAGQFAAVED